MKTNFKRILSAILAVSCVAASAAVNVSAADDGKTIIEYTWDTPASSQYPMTDTTKTTTGGAMNANTSLVTGIGGNDTNSLKVESTSSTNLPMIYHVSYDPTAKEHIDVTAAANKYVRTDLKLYFDGNDGFAGIRTANNWGSQLSYGVTKDQLKAGEWNDITFVTQFTDQAYDDNGSETYMITTDVIVNGVLVVDDNKYPFTRKNTWYEATKEEARKGHFYFTIQPYSDGTNNFTVYADDIKTTTYAEDNFVWGEVINQYSEFSSNTYGILNDTKTQTVGVGGDVGDFSYTTASAIGDNDTTSLAITATKATTFQHITMQRTAAQANAGQGGTVVDLYDTQTNPYLVLEYSLYFDEGSSLAQTGLATSWGSSISPVTADKLVAGEWNKIVYVTKLTNKNAVEGDYCYFDFVSDIFVNGEQVADDAVHNRANHYAGKDATEAAQDAFYGTIQFNGDGTNQYTVYIDDVVSMIKYGDIDSETENYLEPEDPDTVAPKFVDNNYSKVGETDEEGITTLTVIKNTTANQLTTDATYGEMFIYDADYNDVDPDAALSEGDTIEISSIDGESWSSYTVTIAESKLIAPTYYISCSNGWYVYYGQYDYSAGQEKTLEAATYALPAEIYNTTGETVEVMVVIGLYEEDGTLVNVVTNKKEVPSSFSNVNVRTDYVMTADELKDGRYLKAIIMNAADLSPISYGKVN